MIKAASLKSHQWFDKNFLIQEINPINSTMKVDFYSFQINLEVLHQLISLKSNGILAEIYMAIQDVKS